MREAVVTNIGGESRTMNPSQWIAWGSVTDEPAPGQPRRRGFIVTPAGKHDVLEKEEELTKLWREAMAG